MYYQYGAFIMEILYIFGAVLVLLYIFRWDKLRNNDKISKSIDAVMKFILLKPFKIAFFILHEIYEGQISLIKTIYSGICSFVINACKWFDSWSRPLALLASSFIVLVAYIYACYKNYIHYLIPQEADKAIYNTLIPILLGAIPAFFIWKWRNYDKKKDQEHTERELRIKETNNDWDNLQKYQAIIQNGDATAIKRKSAIHALGLYYNRTNDFPQLVHEFFRYQLEEYWKAHQTETQVPIYIQAIYDVLDKQDKIFVSKELSLSGFHLNYYKPSRKDLSNLDLTGVVWDQADFHSTDLSNTSMVKASLIRAGLHKVNLCGADLSSANLIGANLSHITYDKKTDFTEALYLKNVEKFKTLLTKSEEKVANLPNITPLKATLFPPNFNPEAHDMIEACAYYNEYDLWPRW